MKIRNPSARSKIAASLLMPLIIIVGMGIYAIVQISAMQDAIRAANESALPRLEQLNEIRGLIASQRLLASERVLADDAGAATAGDPLGQINQPLEEAVRLYAAGMETDEEATLFGRFDDARRALQASLGEIDALLAAGETDRALARFQADAAAAFDEAAARIGDLEGLTVQRIAVAQGHAEDIAARTRLVLAILIGVSILAAGVGFARVTMAHPMMRISEALRHLTHHDEALAASGDDNPKDEIDALIGAVYGYRESVTRARELAEIAETDRARLHAAIENMTIGLCMFDDDNKIVVANRAFGEIFRLPPDCTLPGTTLSDLVAEQIRQGVFDGDDPSDYVEQVERTLSQQQTYSTVWELKDGRTFAAIFQPMRHGWLTTQEDITERRRSEEHIYHMARHDALTDLPNRRLFGDNVNEALAHLQEGAQLAVLAIDLDRFKGVNDTLGHPVGDATLKQVAARLVEVSPEHGTVARFGGDEFAVMQAHAEQPAAARALAQRFIDTLSETFDVDGQHIALGASIGIALAPGDGATADILLKNADMALYRAKAEGRGIYRFFEAEMDARMQARRRLELDLRSALAEGTFELHYQPVVGLSSNKVSGFEALLRWNHPERGAVSPAEFIPLAEEIGLIVPIGEWVLRQACLDAARWPRGIRVAVNLSPVQFRSKRLAEAVITALAISKLPPSRLELEITEGVLIANTNETLAILHQLRGLGVHIAMDDFGTGYSSLSYLRTFPFDKIKIDGSFIRSMDEDASSMAIVRAVTGLGNSLGMTTTAEGVETTQQLDRVRAEGCSEVQGFLLSEARPAAEIEALIASLSSGKNFAAA